MPEFAPLNFFKLCRAPDRAELAALDPQTLVTARHITTDPDGGTSLEKYGLLPLREVLSLDTPLRRFLADHGIQYIHEKRLFTVNGEPVPLINCMESCASCLVEKAVCRLYSRESKRVLAALYPRLLYEDGSPAFYLYYAPAEEASLPEAKSPQVLRLLDELLLTLGKPAGLADEWMRSCEGNYQVVKRNVELSKLPR